MLDLVKICNRAIESSFYLLFFLTPLIMTPWNHELFEFNKMIFVYLLTILIITAWLIKMVLQRRIIFRRTFLDIPLLLFLTSQFASTLLSIDRHTSFWGYYSRFHGGLASTLGYLLLYWAFASNALDTPGVGECHPPGWRMNPNRFITNCLYVLLASGFLVSGYGILEHFGIDAQYWVQDVQNRVFSTLGQPNWLAAWLAAIIPLTWSFALENQGAGERKKRRTKKRKNRRAVIANFSSRFFLTNLRGLFSQFWANLGGFLQTRRLKSAITASTVYYLLFTIYFLCLLYTKSRSGLLGFGITYLVFWPSAFWLHRNTSKRILKPFLLLTFNFALLTFLIGTPWTPTAKEILSPPVPAKSPEVSGHLGGQVSSLLINISESSDIRKVVWQGAIDIWRHYPIFGTGVETFAYSYYWYRPREHNDLSEWDFLYNKAHNEYLNFAATTGIVGLGSYLLIIGSFSFWSLRELKIKSEKLPARNATHSVAGGKVTVKNSKLTKKKLLTLDCNLALCTLHLALLAGYTSILITNFFGFSVVSVALLFFLYPALASTLVIPSRGVKGKPPSRWTRYDTLGIWQYFFIGLILLVTCYLLLVTCQFWYADFLFAQGEKFNHAGQYDQASQSLQRAIITRPGEPTYHNEFALILSSLAMAAQEQEEGSQSARQLAEMAVFESDQALKISPYHLNFWKNRTRILHQLGEIDEKYLQGALVSLLRASELASTDAKIFYNLALLYAQIGQDQTAIKTLEKTVLLKPNYADARYALALFYEKEEKIKEAKLQLEYILEKINPENQNAQEKIRELGSH